MPSRFAIEIACSGDLEWRPHQLHAVAASWLDDRSSRSKLSPHRSKPRPWSVSPPIDLGRRRYRIEFGLVNDELAVRLAAAAAAAAAGDGIHFGHVKRVHGRLIGAGDALQPVAVEPWDHLLESARAVRYVSLTFLSPTTFHSGRRYVPVPHLPTLVGGYSAAWSVGPSKPGDVDPQAPTIANYDLRTVSTAMRVGDGAKRVTKNVVGFVGTLTVDCKRLSAEQRRALDATFRIATYSGTGALTAQGFGDTFVEVAM